MHNLKDKLYITTVAENDWQVAEEYGLGLEIAEYCTAFNMDQYFTEKDKAVRQKMEHAARFVFHGPFNELCPAAIDPLVVEVTRRRYKQAVDIAVGYGIKKMVLHSGFTPLVYHRDWFVEKSIKFWSDFIKDTPDDFVFCYENVMEDGPDMPFDVVSGVNNPRLGLCLDVGHATTLVSKTPAEKWIGKYGKLMNHVHVHNNVGSMDNHDPLGKGIIDYDKIMGLIIANAPDATITIESVDAKSSCQWLSEHGFLY